MELKKIVVITQDGNYPYTNLITGENVEEDVCLYEDGQTHGPHPGYITSDYIHLNSGCGVYLQYIAVNTGSYRIFCLYTQKSPSSLIHSGVWTGESYYEMHPLNIGADCYIRFTYLSETRCGKTELFHSDFIFDVKWELDIVGNVESIWKGKKVGCLGDSTTAMSQWYNKWAAKSGAVMTSYAISGTTIAGTSSESMCQRYKIMAADLDLVIVFGGVNDQRSGVSLGNFENYNTDGQLDTTFYGALHSLCRGLREKYPTKYIVFMTPMHNSYRDEQYGDSGDYNYKLLSNQDILRENKFPLRNKLDIDDTLATGGKLSEYVDAIKRVCAFYAVYVIDMYAISTFQPLIDSNKNTYLPDGIHPSTTLGAERIANVIYQYLETLKY